MASLLRESHPLTLKVMRLSKPALADTQLLPADSAESVLAQALRDIEQNNPTQSGAVFSSDVQAGEGMAVLDAQPLSETLVLPRAFGTMYLGETFAAHLCICNESTLVVRDILVQVSMQTASQQVPLVDTGDAARQLAAGQPLNLQVVHEIKELGAHVLACSISYLSAQGERRTLQKSFKFQVANPLVVKTKVNHLARDVLLEVQVHNATPKAMALERLRFDAAAPFVSQDLNATAEGQSVWGARAGFMQPGDVRQYLYRLRPQIDAESMSVEQERAVQYATALGKLDIVWRGQFGSVGRLQTSQLLRKSPGMFLIEIESARVLDGHAVVEEPFVARVRVRNVSEQRMTVVAAVNAHKHPMAVVCGPAQHTLGELDVGESAEFDLQLLALAPGVQRIGAVVLVDSVSGYTREVDHLLDVDVRSS
ncbi:Trafficking protein particle complex subunit 13 [Coemansia sp. IMI 203386]|nr:Trafficking protein particle complex subunit 13 [Coemansia sp. IMI 203386]